MNENVFNDYSDFYDIFYKDKDYAGEVNYLSNLLKKYNPNNYKLLEFGSGTGKHTQIFNIGYTVHGIEKVKMISSKTSKWFYLRRRRHM